jgi:pimeloyl-ACP methyl ester carboxylesterase
MRKAYAAPDGLFKDGNKLFIAGTRGARDVADWPKIALGTFKGSKIYKRAEPALKADPEITTVIGHSAGGTAALELEKAFPGRVTSITYGAPVFSPMNPGQLKEADQPLRFKVVGDPVAILDENARVTLQAPKFNVDAFTNLAAAAADPTPANFLKVAREGLPDPTSGLHAMTGNYSQSSSAFDWLKAAKDGIEVAEVVGALGE